MDITLTSPPSTYSVNVYYEDTNGALYPLLSATAVYNIATASGRLLQTGTISSVSLVPADLTSLKFRIGNELRISILLLESSGACNTATAVGLGSDLTAIIRLVSNTQLTYTMNL